MATIQDFLSLHFQAVFLVIIPLFIISLFFRQRHQKLPLPPGPRRLPIIGNMLIMDHLTHRGLAKLAAPYNGLLYLRFGYTNTVVVSNADIARQVFQEHDIIFSNRPASTAITYLTYDRSDMAFADYGPFWRQVRKLCVVKLFSRRRALSWTSVREEVDAMMGVVAGRLGAEFDISGAVFQLTMNLTLRAAFGTRSHEDLEQFTGIIQEFSKLFHVFNIGDFFPWLKWLDVQGINKRLRAARTGLDRIIDVIIDKHLENPKEDDAVDADMVDEMLKYYGESVGSKDEGGLKLTRNNIKAIIMDVMFGGTETVASAIEWTMAELLRNPEELVKLQRELNTVVGPERRVQDSDLDNLPYLKCIIKETLRLHPPIPLPLHETATDCEVAGYFVPAKSRVMVNVWAICRDKSVWKEPEKFRPGRFGDGGEAASLDFKGGHFEFLPFGAGRRSCPGMQLGLFAVELAVASLVHSFEWKLPEGMEPSELNMDDVFGLSSPRAVKLLAVPTARMIAC